MVLQNSGTFRYNGVDWTSLYKSKVEVKPIKDSAGRALVAREYSIEVEGYIANQGGTTDDTLGNLRINLEKPGGELIYSNKGFGSLEVNVAGGAGVRDCAYGPWPEVLSWQPLGNDRGCLVKWKCSTQIACEENPAPKGILEYCWTEAWDIDDDGYTTRTIDGHLTIAATRTDVNNRTILDNADVYLDKIVPDLPTGFRRIQNRKLSEDKRTIEFHFADEEMALPLPAGVSNAEVRHKVAWHFPHGHAPHAGSSSIGGTITLPVGVPKSRIWDVILLILQSRWPPLQNKPIANSGKALWWMQSFEIDDELFGRSTSFSASAILLGGNANSPQTIMKSSGLWTPVPGTSFQQWKTSMFQKSGSGKPFAPRGMAGMSFQNGDDAIVDLCARTQPPTIATKIVGKSLISAPKVNRQSNGQDVDPDNSWLQYRLRLRLREQDNVAIHKPLVNAKSARPVPVLQGFIAKGLVNIDDITSADESTTPQGPGYTSNKQDLLQQVGTPNFLISLVGHAVRVAYPIPTPRLNQVGGVQVRQVFQDVEQEQIAVIGGLPIFAARWRVDYVLPSEPKQQLPMPVNPAIVE